MNLAENFKEGFLSVKAKAIALSVLPLRYYSWQLL